MSKNLVKLFLMSDVNLTIKNKTISIHIKEKTKKYEKQKWYIEKFLSSFNSHFPFTSRSINNMHFKIYLIKSNKSTQSLLVFFARHKGFVIHTKIIDRKINDTQDLIEQEAGTMLANIAYLMNTKFKQDPLNINIDIKGFNLKQIINNIDFKLTENNNVLFKQLKFQLRNNIPIPLEKIFVKSIII